MTPAHVHLVLNHIPIVGLPLVTAFLVHALVTNDVKARKFALWVMVVIAAIVLPVFFTGEPAEEAVENLPAVAKSAIHDHEEAGELSLILSAIVGFLSLGSLYFLKNEKRGKTAAWVAVAGAVVAMSSLALTGNAGGKIRHVEGIQTGAVPTEADHADDDNR